MKNLVVLTGAGVSAESGIATFRDAGGLWEGHDIMEVASPEGYAANPALVLDFYNKRRAQLKDVDPNEAHFCIAGLERNFHVDVITQNVDDLHERAGSSNVIHLHGELKKARSSKNSNEILEWEDDINLGDLSKDGSQLRPHIVWFGEEVPAMEQAIEIVSKADVLLIVGTSMQVYPAAGLKDFAPSHAPIYFVDPAPSLESAGRLNVIKEKAGKGVQMVADLLSF
ncbi:NAD-dependent deacetylase [Nonlabens dokdonensis]|jgi:NAD-dependent deacetylase|uniref:NAD-dependent protein deacylase n=2 Tax=Nonlabens dokdonensis TaxID=328515 RepID=L7WBH5_NONDD|nr:NAD-dependent deacylase [Nonlabens dokdonensis]AGC77562.1 NAD-dependent deacetylase, Sir2 family [Nonlabens dokdonensis DSW-6]PZX39885.1 NAD-dependent deacetylase [Nonlabens dokdonensis]